MQQNTRKRRHKLRGAKVCVCGGRVPASSASSNQTPGTNTGNSMATSAQMAPPMTPPAQGQPPQEAAPKAKPQPILTQAQIAKLENDFARRIIDLQEKIKNIPGEAPAKLIDGIESSYQYTGSSRRDNMNLPLSNHLLKFRQWLYKECEHLKAKVDRICADSRQRLATAGGGSNSATLSGTPTSTGTSGSQHRSAIGTPSSNTP